MLQRWVPQIMSFVQGIASGLGGGALAEGCACGLYVPGGCCVVGPV